MKVANVDQYQQRYEAHQARKRDVLVQIMEERESTRIFSDKPVNEKLLQEILDSRLLCPSSCDRQAIYPMVEIARDRKATLSGLLVGATGWAHRAPAIVTIWADPTAYRAGDEVKWNSYLDAGIVIQNYCLLVTAMGLKCCIINPNVRDFNKSHFQTVFSPMFGPEPEDLAPVGIFCGALAIGHPR